MSARPNLMRIKYGAKIAPGVLSVAVSLTLVACAASAPPKTAASTPPPAAVIKYDTDPFPSTYKAYPGVPTLVRDVTIYDGKGGRIDHGAVLFADGEVVAVGQDIVAPADAVVIDGSGKWL